MDFNEIAALLDQEKDSLELSTPAKGGAIKVYGNANKPDEFLAKIKRMLELRKEANLLLEGGSLADESRDRARKDFIV